MPSGEFCYCAVCSADNAIRVEMRHPAVVQPFGIALCAEHADLLANLLMSETRAR